MSELFDKFDRTPVREVTDEAIQRAEDHADQEWKDAALEVVRTLSLTRRSFTAGDVMELLDGMDVATHEPRALGAIMRIAQSDGWIEATDLHINSGKKRNHNRPQRVWRSLNW